MLTTKVKVTSRQDKALDGFEAWRRTAIIILNRLHSDASDLLDEVNRRKSPLFNAVGDWALKEFRQGLEEVMGSICSCQPDPEGEVDGLPDPLSGCS